MIRLVSVLVLMLSPAVTAAAQAQTFDGAYKGTITVTKRVLRSGDDTNECPRVGNRNPVTVTVSGGAVTLTNPFTTYSGTIAPGGKVEIRGSRLAAGGYGRVVATYTGTVRGGVIAGSGKAIGPNVECFSVFRARR
jgi:hypothetical protein